MGRGPRQILPRNKKLISKNTMLIFPDFNKVFEIHTEASDYQLSLVISQDQKPIAFYSKKLTTTQHSYTVKTLNEFHNIFLVHKLKIYANHKNLINSTTVSKSAQIQRW
jgi:hypothetical protein